MEGLHYNHCTHALETSAGRTVAKLESWVQGAEAERIAVKHNSYDEDVFDAARLFSEDFESETNAALTKLAAAESQIKALEEQLQEKAA